MFQGHFRTENLVPFGRGWKSGLLQGEISVNQNSCGFCSVILAVSFMTSSFFLLEINVPLYALHSVVSKLNCMTLVYVLKVSMHW